RPHRHCTSFPTRRSSDLNGKTVGTQQTNICTDISQLANHATTYTNIRLTANSTANQFHGDGCTLSNFQGYQRAYGKYSDLLPFRSEEHTTELQSRENLVC